MYKRLLHFLKTKGRALKFFRCCSTSDLKHRTYVRSAYSRFHSLCHLFRKISPSYAREDFNNLAKICNKIKMKIAEISRSREDLNGALTNDQLKNSDLMHFMGKFEAFGESRS